MTGRDGRISRLEQVFLRGGQIKFVVVPELLKNAPVFKKVQAMRAKTIGEPQPSTKSKGKKPVKK
jgi:small nuclear ribonucleoprotein D3